MDKQLREDLEEIYRSYIRIGNVNEYDLIPHLIKYINDNYVSKDKVRGLKMRKIDPFLFVKHKENSLKRDGFNEAVSEINTAIDTLVSVPTPESLIYDL